jgi:hypothetical protein
MAQAQAVKPQPAADKSRQRSPNYPAIGLRAAIEKVKLLYEADKKAGAPIDAALRHMGFSKRHGQAMAVLSAVKKFDLVEETSGRVVPTQRAIDILVFPDKDDRRMQALRACALSPAVYRELYEQYKATGIPSEETLRAELIADKHFNPNAVEGFIQDFKDTLIFSGIMNPVELSLHAEDNLEMSDSAQSSTQTNVNKVFSQTAQGLVSNMELSIPVEFSSDSQEPVIARIRFNAPIKKEYLTKVRAFLEAWEKTS